MIRLAAEYFFLCAINTLHPTIFVNQYGSCVAMCDENSDRPHSCYDSYGMSLTGCFDDRGRSILCDAYIYIIDLDDYDIVKKANNE
jgi:hypothetical protein